MEYRRESNGHRSSGRVGNVRGRCHAVRTTVRRLSRRAGGRTRGLSKTRGRDPRAGFSFGADYHLAKTIGNYWPYSTTVYDYIRRAMPLTAPGSLQPNEIYSVIAYLLAENQIIDKRTVVDARSLPRIRMPARDRFVPDDRTRGPVFR